MPDPFFAALERNFGATATEIVEEATALVDPAVTFTLHPLGFWYRRVREGATGSYIRLHVWPTQRHPAAMPILPHTHSSDLWSLVLAGEIADQTWRPSEDPDDSIWRVMGVERDATGRRRSVPQDGLRLRATSRHVYRAPASYHVPQGRVHSSDIVGQEVCVTLVLRAPKDDRVSLVAGATLPGPHPERLRAPLPLTDLGDLTMRIWRSWG